MKKAFSQNGRRNFAVVVDLLFTQQDGLCAIAMYHYIEENIIPGVENDNKTQFKQKYHKNLDYFCQLFSLIDFHGILNTFVIFTWFSMQFLLIVFYIVESILTYLGYRIAFTFLCECIKF